MKVKEGHCFRENAQVARRRSRSASQRGLRKRAVFHDSSMAGAGIGISVARAMAVKTQPDRRFVRLNDERTVLRMGTARLRHRSPSREGVLLDEIQQNAACAIRK